MKHVVFDTNVLLYARDAGEPRKQPRAAAWLELLWQQQLGRTSVQVLSEYYVNVTRKLDPGLPAEEAWADVTALLTWRPQPVDDTLMLLGREIEHRHHLSWWESLVVGAAQLQGCATLLTEDLEDGGLYGGVTVGNPFTHALDEPLPAYAVASPVTRGHPARGRPRK